MEKITIITEYCPYCEDEVEIVRNGDEMVGKCPHCQHTLLLCSLCDCDNADCAHCPYEKEKNN